MSNLNGDDPDNEDHYSLLGVSFTATHAEITRAYRQAMKRAHPDRALLERRTEAELLSRRLNAAYAVLSDPIKRQAYDRTIRQQVIQDQIMRRYVGGFQTYEPRGPAQEHQRRAPTATEQRDRQEADRRASLSLVLVAVGVTAVFLAAVLIGGLLGALLDVIR
jgi:DnaJ-class molecular chaperone